ncbi:MAG: serine hydrolase [Rhodanobacter sp.]
MPSSATRALTDSTQEVSAYRHYLEQCHTGHVCNGVYLVARHGKPIFVEAFGDVGDDARTPLAVDSAFDIGSISKQFTAMAVLKLEAQGKLSSSDRVATYLPDFPYKQVTIAQLLSHTSGIPDILVDYTKLLRSGPLREPITTRHVVHDLVTKGAALKFEPGSRYEYSNTAYLVLAALVEATTHQPFAAYLQQTFFKPLGMQHTWLRTPDSDKLISSRALGFLPAADGTRKAYDQFSSFYIRGAGGIYTTVQDLLRWENALASGRVVPQHLWLRAIMPTRLTDGRYVPYGFGLSLKPDGRGKVRISHGGHWRGFKSDLSYFPEMDLTVIQLTNNGEDDSVDANVTALETLADGGTPDLVGPRIGPELYARLGENPQQVRAWFDGVLAGHPKPYDLQEGRLNALGYALLSKKEAGKAVLVFQLSTMAFPNSANTYDSLADAYEAQGEISAALTSVRTAAALEPTSVRLRERRDALASRLKSAE